MIVSTIGNGILSNNSVAVIGNVDVEILLTEIKVTLVGLDHNLSKKPIPI